MRCQRLLCLLALAFSRQVRGQDVVVTSTPMYGPTAILTGGAHEIRIALNEGGRVVSWKVSGTEVGFVGRIWGGDMSDALTLDGASTDLRFHPVEAVETLKQGSCAAVRVTLAAKLDEHTVRYSRVIGLDTKGAFLETTFPFATSPGTLWYAFGAQFTRKPAGGEAVRLLFLEEGETRERVLEPKEMKGFAFPPAPEADSDSARRRVVLSHPGLRDALALSVFGSCDVGLKVWSGSFQLAPGKRFEPGERMDPVRLRLEATGREEASAALSERVSPWVAPAGEWRSVELPPQAEPVRPPMPPIVAAYSRYGACNSTAAFMAPLAAGGVGWVRVGGFSWAACEATRGTVDWTGAETSLEAAEEEGLATIGLFSGNPGWATASGDRRAPPNDWAAWEQHVERTVHRYRERVHVWEVWNEPDIGSFWQGTVDEYVELLRHAYIAAKRADPECLVMSAGLDGSGEAYLVEMLERGAGRYCDLVGAHPYAGSAGVAALRMRIMRRILAFHGVDKPLWITEVGWQSGGWKAGPGVVADEEVKAQRLRDACPLLLEHADVVCWYKGVEAGSMYGLMQPVGQRGFRLQPAWHRMRELALPATTEVVVEAPPSIALPAGKATALSGCITNGGAAPVLARWVGAEPDWGPCPTVTVPPGTSRDVPVTLTPRAYERPHGRDLILAVQRGSRHTAGRVVSLSVTNTGRICELSLSGGWIRRLDREGKPVGSWEPSHAVVTAPGGGFIQPLRPTCRGNFKETATLEVRGSAAKWVGDVPTSVALTPDKPGWVGLHVRVPDGVLPGTYVLEATLRSTTFADVSASFAGSYTVGRRTADE